MGVGVGSPDLLFDNLAIDVDLAPAFLTCQTLKRVFATERGDIPSMQVVLGAVL